MAPPDFRPTLGASLGWTGWDGPQASLEHVEVSLSGEQVVVRGVVIGAEDGRRFGLRYALRLDADWTVRRACLTTASGRELDLAKDGHDRWRDRDGVLSQLDGCLDLDITVTPLTNTLPIRRLGLRSGESRELRLAYIALPDLALSVARQRYTALDAGRLYRFESLDSDFTADLLVDANGFVRDYPGLFRRL